MRFSIAVLTAVVVSACFQPPHEVVVGSQDGGDGGGSAGGGQGGGSAGGGQGGGSVGGGQGGGSVGGGQGGGSVGGGQGGGNVGEVARPAAITPANCVVPRPAGTCGVAGPCILFQQKGQPTTERVSAATMGEDPSGLLALNSQQVVYALRTQAAPVEYGVAWTGSLAGARIRLATAPVSSQPSIEAVNLDASTQGSDAVSYVLGWNTQAGRTHDLYRGATLVRSLPERPTDPRLWRKGSEWYFITSTGAYRTSAASAPVAFATGSVTALEVTGTDLFASVCSAPRADCHVRRFAGGVGSGVDLGGGTAEPIDSMKVIGGSLWTLTGRTLTEIPLATQVPQVRYRGDAFAQHAGTLLARSLRADGSKVVFGQVCEFTPAAPTYGSIELDPAALTSRWLNEDPGFPFLPVLSPAKDTAGAPWANAHGLYE